MGRAILITGGNVGDVAQNIAAAKAAITQRVGSVVAQSSVAESEAWGVVEGDGGRFLNQVLVVETKLTPMELLRVTQKIELELGRDRDSSAGRIGGGEKREKTYQSRTMDIDILLYDDQIIDTPELTLPHPLMAEREFVLRPLSEVEPQYVDPVTGVTIEQMLQRLIASETL